MKRFLGVILLAFSATLFLFANADSESRDKLLLRLIGPQRSEIPSLNDDHTMDVEPCSLPELINLLYAVLDLVAPLPRKLV